MAAQLPRRTKKKKYDWKDSNMALFGSDTEKQVKKESAQKEVAWKNAGRKPGLQVWRINKFKVECWPTQQYGQFFEGDSYIILNTYKDESSDKLLYDIHFWIGKYSTQDEYGTAAYKTVELDTLLDDIPIQHREVQHHESALFKTYFPDITYNKGGADSGFNHVEPEKYVPRLYKVSGEGKNIKAMQVKVKRDQLTSCDCFVLDAGKVFYLFKGSESSHKEGYRATTLLSKLQDSRPGCTKHTLDEREGDCDMEEFYEALDKADKAMKDDDTPEQMAQDQQEADNDHGLPKLIRISDAGGELNFAVVKEGCISKGDFNKNDVFILDTCREEVFVWVGNCASENEKKNGMPYAHWYLQSNSRPYQPVTVLTENQANTNPCFKAALQAIAA